MTEPQMYYSAWLADELLAVADALPIRQDEPEMCAACEHPIACRQAGGCKYGFEVTP